mmetsp:Transcript_74396/g.155093  ORF Transcript_74396/g.155093 Transcript_74396/m.155093 type:complete len:247 (+) Transcript_74396:844-1584(+)
MLRLFTLEHDVHTPADRAKAGGATRSMQVCLLFSWNTQIDYQVDLLHIHASRQEVCANEDPVMAELQPCESLRPPSLIHPPAGRCSRDSTLIQELSNLNCTVGVWAEDECLAIGGCTQHFQQGWHFLPGMITLDDVSKVQDTTENGRLDICPFLSLSGNGATTKVLFHCGATQKYRCRQISRHCASFPQLLLLDVDEESLSCRHEWRQKRGRDSHELKVITPGSLGDAGDVVSEVGIQQLVSLVKD